MGRPRGVPKVVELWTDAQGFGRVGRTRRHRTPSAIVEDRTGQQALLKWQVVDDPHQWTRDLRVRDHLLRRSGSRVPSVLAAGVAGPWACYLQELLVVARGSLRRGPTSDLVVDAVSKQRGLAPAGSSHSAGSAMEDALLGHGEGRFGHARIAAHPEGHALLERMRQAGRRAPALPALDVCHFDLVPSNVLRTVDGSTAIVDWDHAGWGDAAFDLVTLDIWGAAQGTSARARAPLAAACRSWAEPELLGAYAAVVVLWWVNDGMRGDRRDVGRIEWAHRVLDRWLAAPARGT